jgi:hypothetical protein
MNIMLQHHQRNRFAYTPS